MRAVVGSVLALIAAACVPDFAYREGGDGGSSTDAGQGGRNDGQGGASVTGQGGAGGRSSSGVGVATGPGAGPGAGPGPGPGPATTTGSSTTDTTVTTGGDGGGTTTTTGDPTVTSSSVTTGSGTPGVPCWDGFNDQQTTCTDGDVCCFDPDFPSEHECTVSGDCTFFETELGCNEPSDCGGALCCANLDGLGYLLEITCDSSCQDFVACSAQEDCPGGTVCYYVFPPEDYPDYVEYGYCDAPR